jgi:hypothetical protein
MRPWPTGGCYTKNKQTNNKSEYDAKVANINLTLVLFHKNEPLPGAGVRGQ